MNRAAWQFLLIAALLWFHPAAQAGAGDRDPPIGGALAVLRLENLAKDPKSDHWQSFLASLLERQLGELRSIRPAPESSRIYAYSELGLPRDRAITDDLARRLGKTMEVKWLVWGSYDLRQEKKQLTVQVMDVTSGRVSKVLTASSRDWWETLTSVSHLIISDLGLSVSPEEKTLMDRSPTTSAEGLELLSQAVAEMENDFKPATLDKIRRAVSLDPKSARPRTLLAIALASTGELDEATMQAKTVVQTFPNYSRGHYTLGSIFRIRNIPRLAEEEFRLASQLEPDSEDLPLLLGVIYADRKDWAAAISAFQKATQLAPLDPTAPVQLAMSYLAQGKPAQAQTELKTCDRLVRSNSNPRATAMLAQAWDALNDIPNALKYYKQALTGEVAANLDGSSRRLADQKIAALEATLTPQPVVGTVPESAAPDSTAHLLAEKLSADELKLVENPLISSAAIESRARELAANATDELEKGRRLFLGVLRPFVGEAQSDAKSRRRTAVTAMADWGDPAATLGSHDYAYLYVVMARHLGLKAWVATVDDRPTGTQLVSPACAAISLRGKVYLLDPRARWFGAPRQRLRLLNDTEVIGRFLSDSGDPAKEDVALKLCPTWAELYFHVALSRLGRKEKEPALAALQAGLRRETNTWLAVYAQGQMHLDDGKWSEALRLLEKCLELDPQALEVHYPLGVAYYRNGDRSQARDHLRAYLTSAPDPATAEQVRKMLSSLDGSTR